MTTTTTTRPERGAAMSYAIFDAWDNGACIEEVQPWELGCFESTLAAMDFDEVFAWAIEGATETNYIVVRQYDADGHCVREESEEVSK
jgi:hypothetical protein